MDALRSPRTLLIGGAVLFIVLILGGIWFAFGRGAGDATTAGGGAVVVTGSPSAPAGSRAPPSTADIGAEAAAGDSGVSQTGDSGVTDTDTGTDGAPSSGTTGGGAAR